MKEEKFRINLKKIDEKIRERENIPLGKFLKIAEEIMKIKNEAKIVNTRYL